MISEETLEEQGSITEEITDDVDKIIEHWRNEEGNLIMVFHAVQDLYGYVPRNVAMYVGKKLGVPLARIYEVITFYNFFNLEPPAEYTVAVCTGTACHLKGAPEIIDEFKKQLNIPAKEVYDENKKFKIDEVRCLGCCGLAPVVTINGEVYGKVKPENVEKILSELETKKEDDE